MINGQPRTDDSHNRPEASDRYLSLVLEIDAAIAGGAATELESTSLEGLTPDERNRLREARQCLELLYDEAVAGRDSTTRGTPGAVLGDASAVRDSTRPDVVWDETILGTRMGRFEVLREIGRGGHGVVFLALDPTLNRCVALKMPHPEILLAPSMRRRFLAEGKAAALLTHPNIVTVYEAGEIGPVCYLAQEFVTGVTLSQWLRREPTSRTSQMVAAIVAQLADGVDHAHKRGLLHRDLKPSNVILQDDSTSTNEAGLECAREGLPFTPKIMDFGIAKTLEAEADETATGTVIGTAAYMSPEQAAGQNRSMGPASDVYSLGAILYEMLTGRAVFEGSTRVETLRLVTTVEPTAPRSLRRDIPRDLESICLKCLEKDPLRRYRSAFELGADLRRFLNGEATQARPTTSLERVVRWCRRRPAVASLIGVSLAALVALLAVVLWSNSRLEQMLADTRDARRRAERNEALANQREVAAQTRAYAADMRLVAEYWNESNAGMIEGLMQPYVPLNGRVDLRGFEWWLYHRLLNPNNGTNPPGAAGESEASIAVGANAAANRGSDASIRLPPADSTGRVVQEYTLARDISSVVMSPNGRRIAVGTADGATMLLDFATLQIVLQVKAPGAKPAGIAFSPDSEVLAVVAAGEPLRLYSSSAKPREIEVPATSQISGIRFSPDGRTIVVPIQSDVVVIDVERGVVADRLVHRGAVRAVAFIDDDKLLTICSGSLLYRWSLRETRKPNRVALDSGELSELAVSLDAQCVAVRGDRRVIILDLPTLDILANLPDRGEPGGMVFLGKGRTLLTAESPSRFRLWQTSTWQQMGHIDAKNPLGVSASADGYRLASYGRNSLIAIDASPDRE